MMQEDQTIDEIYTINNNNLFYQEAKINYKINTLGEVQSYCSWCFEETTHFKSRTRLIKKWNRSEYYCTKCNKETVFCFSPLCNGMARSFNSKSDFQCFKCKNISMDKQIERECTWCGITCFQILEEKNYIARSIYRCSGCSGRNLECRTKDCNIMARGTALWNNEYCFHCYDSKYPEERKVIKDTWCSYCFSKSNHILQDDNTGRRDAYSCSFCYSRTLLCSKCKKAMACGGSWDDFTCAFCEINSKVDRKLISLHGRFEVQKMDIETKWQRLDELRNSVCEKYPENDLKWIEEELRRTSEEKEKAMDSGMIEPFLILVTMSPMKRLIIAASLGWSNVTQDFFRTDYDNYVHEEVWYIINCNLIGIQARGNKTREKINILAHNCTWYEILERTCQANFKFCQASHYYNYSKLLKLSQEANNKEIDNLKKEWLERLWFFKVNNHSISEIKSMKIFMLSFLDPTNLSAEAYELPFLFQKSQLKKKKEITEFIKNNEQELLSLVQAQLVKTSAQQVYSASKQIVKQIPLSKLFQSICEETSIIGKLSKNLFGPKVSDVVVEFISRQIAKALVSLNGEAIITYSTAELAVLVSGMIIPAIDAIFAIILLYQVLSLFIGSSPERLLFTIEQILIRWLDLKERKIDVNDYFTI